MKDNPGERRCGVVGVGKWAEEFRRELPWVSPERVDGGVDLGGE